MKAATLLLRKLLTVLVLVPNVSQACTVCMGDGNSNFASAANGAIFLMLGFIGTMLAGMIAFGFYLYKRGNAPIPSHIQLVEEMGRQSDTPYHA